MQINLRYGNKLRSRVNRTLCSLVEQAKTSPQSYSAVLDVRIPDNVSKPMEVIEAVRQNYLAKIVTASSLRRIEFDLRQSIAEANVTTGVSQILTRLAEYDSELSLYTVFAQLAPNSLLNDPKIIKGTITRVHEAYNADPENATSIASVPVFTQDDIKKFQEHLLHLRREREELSEKLLKVNAENHIDFPEEDMTFLQDQGII